MLIYFCCYYSVTRKIKLWRVWKIGRLVFVSVPSVFIVAIAKQVPGLGYMAAHPLQKNPFYFKKPTHTCNIQCVPRRKVNHNHLLSQGIFIQQPVFEEKHEYQINFICGRFHLCTAPVVRSL